MRQLSSLDAQFLAIEDGRRTGHVGSLAVHDPSTAPGGTMTCASVRALLRERLHLLPPLRWRLVEIPFGLDYPYWTEDDNFDLTYHVRESALPTPGSDRQLAELISRIHARQLDRSRPLWEMYVISGLQSGHVALYTKIHHAVIDGISGAEILGLLLDLSPEQRPIPPPGPDEREPPPGRVQLWGRALLGVSRYPMRVARALPEALPNLDETTLSGIPGVAQTGRLLGRLERFARRDEHRTIRPELRAPRTSFNRRLSASRRVAFGSVDLQRVKDVKNAHQVTVNDVVVAMCAGSVRRWLLDHKDLPDEPLVAQVPVSVRTEEQAGTYGNHVLMMATPVYTNIADPVERLTATSAGLRDMKERHRALPADLLSDVNNFIPPALFSRAARAILALSISPVGHPMWNLVVSNVPGPQFPLYCGGARMVSMHPVSVITDGMGLNITVMSYDGNLNIGVLVDRDLISDPWPILDGLDLALTELEDAQPKPRNGR